MLLSLICEKLWTDQVIFQLYPARTNSFQIPSEGTRPTEQGLVKVDFR